MEENDEQQEPQQDAEPPPPLPGTPTTPTAVTVASSCMTTATSSDAVQLQELPCLFAVLACASTKELFLLAQVASGLQNAVLLEDQTWEVRLLETFGGTLDEALARFPQARGDRGVPQEEAQQGAPGRSSWRARTRTC